MKFVLVPLFFPRNEHIAESIRYSTTALVSEAECLCPYVAPPLCPIPLWSYDLSIGIFRRLTGFGFQYGRGSLIVVFLRVLGIVACPALGGLLA